MNFEKFKAIVRGMGGMWATNNVVFSRSQSEYHAQCGDESVHLVVPGGYWSARGEDATKRMTW